MKLKNLLFVFALVAVVATAALAAGVPVRDSSASKPVPQGWTTRPYVASMQVAAACALTTPTTATIITDADCWSAAYTDPASTTVAGGFIPSATGGTVTVPRAMRVKVSYGFSEFTVVNSQVITTQIFVGSTAKGGISKITQLGTGDSAVDVNGVAAFDAAAGDVISVKGIADTGNLTVGEGYLIVEEI